MRRLPMLFVVMAVFACSSVSYADSVRVLVYKGTIKASHSIFDVNDANTLVSGTIHGYWAVEVVDTGTDKGLVIDSNAVIYDTREKYYKVIPDAIHIDPCDPCGVVMFTFYAANIDGQMNFYAVGKGKLTKFSNNAAVAKDFVPKTLKGTGLLYKFDVFDPNDTYSGPITVTLTLDSARTRAANPDIYTVDEITNDVVTQLTSKPGWREWPYIFIPHL